MDSEKNWWHNVWNKWKSFCFFHELIYIFKRTFLMYAFCSSDAGGLRSVTYTPVIVAWQFLAMIIASSSHLNEFFEPSMGTKIRLIVFFIMLWWSSKFKLVITKIRISDLKFTVLLMCHVAHNASCPRKPMRKTQSITKQSRYKLKTILLVPCL